MRNIKNIFALAALLMLLHSATLQAQFIVNNGIALTNSTVLSTNGDWTSASGSLLVNNGLIKISDAFVNNGVLADTSTGGFQFDITVQQVTFAPGGSSIGYITKTGTGAIDLVGSVHVKDSLLLKGGKIYIAAGDTIVLTKNTLVVAAPNAFAEGLIAYAGRSGDLFFPLGRDGRALPLTVFKVQSPRVTATIVDAPGTATAGPGVDAIINFPYMWKIAETNAADTAAYLQVNYPATLPNVENAIVTRVVNGNVYTSMGARLIQNEEGIVKVRSYSRGLHGLFGVAQGFAGDPVTDSLALVALYQNTGGPTWTNNASWLQGDVETWFGVTKTGQTITQVSLNNNNLNGEIPDEFVDILGLQQVNFAQNAITTIPDFRENPEITSLDVSENRLTFASLEPNATVPGLHYVNQSAFGEEVDSLVSVNEPYTLSLDAGGSSTLYQWKRNGANLDGASGNVLEITALNKSNMGEYVLQATNPNLPALTLTSEIQNVLAYATISGTLKATANDPATAGSMTLYKIQPSAFEKQTPVQILPDGTFFLDKVVLADYQLLGFADTIAHPGSIPTYYMNTYLWEEADTLFLEDHVAGLEILTSVEPEPPSGRGSISGLLQEDDGTGRANKVLKPKKVQGAGVSARRVERGGRGMEEAEILTLVAYVFTDAEGQFNLTNLPEGEYRLNIQYPGYPMDTTSDITLMVGSGPESQVGVEANVIDGKINVNKLTITGIYQAEGYQAELYPNPAIDYVHLKFGRESANRKVVLTDIQGKTMISERIPGKEEKISVQGFQRGMYLLQVLEKGKVAKTLKLSIE